MQTHREAFERWCNEREYTPLYFDNGMYFDRAIHMAYLAWIASREAITIPLPTTFGCSQNDYKSELIDVLDNLGLDYI